MPRIVALAGLVLASAALRGSDFDVVINEIHYNTFLEGSESTREFVELANVGGDDVDLEGWALTRGISYTFEAGTTIPAGGYLVVSPDPAAAESIFALESVAGPYTGRLDNDGEIIELRNASGRVISRLHWSDETPWPSRADGLGPSMEFTGADSGNDQPSRWKSSRVFQGTPGRPNSRREPPRGLPPSSLEALVRASDVWATFEGRSEPATPLGAWAEPGFDDSGWESRPGSFGYGTNHGFPIATQLDDMRFNYGTFYMRRGFVLDAATVNGLRDETMGLRLRISYDDAFVAYVDGVEVGRTTNLPAPGAPLPFSQLASQSASGSVELDLSDLGGTLEPGPHVLALQAFNAQVGNADFYIAPELLLEDFGDLPPSGGPDDDPYLGRIINEVRPTSQGEPGFVELFNPYDEPLDLSGHFVMNDESAFVELPAGTVLDTGDFLTIAGGEFRRDLPRDDTSWVLFAPDGVTIVDAVRFELRDNSTNDGTVSTGRYPDGDDDVFVFTEPTPGSSNIYDYVSPVVINEIQFHPEFVPPSGECTIRCSDVLQWVELHNRGASSVDLAGWSLTKGVLFDMPPGTTIAAGGYLIVAASEAAFRDEYPGVTNVVGGWERRLSHGSDTINLKDLFGNRVDHVEYGDGGPMNDEAPADGDNDRTFHGSPWPQDADGSGRTLELVHASLDNRAGYAWRASSGAGGTPGAQNSTRDTTPAPTIDDVNHEPETPSSSESVRVTCRISSVGPLQTAELRWAVDGAGGTQTVLLRDDGTNGDREAGDGRYAAIIPPQDDGDIVRFSIVAATSSETSRFPREPQVAPYGGYPGTFCLFEVDDSTPPQNGSPAYRLLLTGADLAQLRSRPVTSDVLLPATFIAGDSVRYAVGLRFRGESSRREPNRSYRIDFWTERLFEGAEHLNINGSNGGGAGTENATELLASGIFRRAGAEYHVDWSVDLHFPGEVNRDFDTRYLRKENFDDAFLTRFYGSADGGNLYRPRNPNPGGDSGDLSYLGENTAPYRPLYEKKSNREEDDYSDIIELTRAFDRTETPNNIFADTLEQLINPRQWAQFFAIQACLSNTDGGIWNNNGEDFFLYHLPTGVTHPDAGKWHIIVWDIEETFQDSNERLFRPTVPAIVRFLSEPRFARLYYEELAVLVTGAFSRFEMRKQYGLLDAMYPPGDVFNVVDPIDAYITRRLGFVKENVPERLTGGPGAPGAIPGETLIDAGDTWRYFKGTEEPSNGPLEWTELNFDDDGWDVGPSGFGFGDGDDATLLTDMEGNYNTVFIRRRFFVQDPAEIGELTFVIDYDDAFVAYVNGVEIARSDTAPAGPISAGDNAQGSHESSGNFPNGPGVELWSFAPADVGLSAGDNIIAVVGLNSGPGSSDFSLIPALLASAGDGPGEGAGCDDVIFVDGSSVRLVGRGDPITTYSVTIDGRLADLGLITGGDGPYGVTWDGFASLLGGDDIVRVDAWSGPDGTGDLVQSYEIDVRAFSGGFTDRSGSTSVDQTWTAAGGPYVLSDRFEVIRGATLTIEPGTVILAEESGRLVINGELVAVGTAEQPIVFRPRSCADRWDGISFTNTGTGGGSPEHHIAFCDFRGGEAAQGAAGFVAPANARVRIEDCRFFDIAANVIDASASQVVVERCEFGSIREGVHCTNSTTTVLDCVFDGMVGDTDAIDFDGSGGGQSRIERCVFRNGMDDGLDMGGNSPIVRDNVFFRIADKAISMEGNGPSGSPIIEGNLIIECGSGMALKNGITVQGSHNTVSRCQQGIWLFGKDDNPEGGHGVFDSLIVWSNAVNVLVDEVSTVTITDSLVGGPVVWPGQGNLLADPMFVYPLGGDYSLRLGSPCIGTGRDGSDMGAIPFTGPTGFVRGDATGDLTIELGDAVRSLNSLFRGMAFPPCLDALDTNDDGSVDVSDPVFELLYLFAGGPPMPAPFPQPGPDPTPDDLPCPGA